MKPFLFQGFTRGNDGALSVEIVYHGFDGAAGQAAWEKAIAVKSYERGERHYLIGGVPLPTVPVNTIETVPVSDLPEQDSNKNKRKTYK